MMPGRHRFLSRVKHSTSADPLDSSAAALLLNFSLLLQSFAAVTVGPTRSKPIFYARLVPLAVRLKTSFLVPVLFLFCSLPLCAPISRVLPYSGSLGESLTFLLNCDTSKFREAQEHAGLESAN